VKEGEKTRNDNDNSFTLCPHRIQSCSNSTNKIVNLLRPLVERLSTAQELDFFSNYFKEILQDMHGMDQMIRILLERGSDNIHWERTKFRSMLRAIRDIILWRDRGNSVGTQMDVP